MTTNALLIIDVQRDFCEGGSLAVVGGNQVARDIAYYLFDDAAYDYIVTTQDWHLSPGDHWSDTPDFVDTWPVHCAANTFGAELHEAIKDLPTDARFFKGKYSAAYSGFEGITERADNVTHRLDYWLRERDVDMVDICGIATDYCVKATALDAVRLGFDTTLLLPLCAAVSPETERAAIEEMVAAGVRLA